MSKFRIEYWIKCKSGWEWQDSQTDENSIPQNLLENSRIANILIKGMGPDGHEQVYQYPSLQKNLQGDLT
jgi:hypothetical protein